MLMSNIPNSITDFHYYFKHFGKLIHLPVILQHDNVLKAKVISVSVLFEWLFSTV